MSAPDTQAIQPRPAPVAAPQAPSATPAARAPEHMPAPRWALHKRLYNWMLSFADKPYGTLALAIFSFCEAIFFPVPPFVLQIPMSLERRPRTWWYAGVTTLASVFGGAFGYALGALLTSTMQSWFPSFFGADNMAKVSEYTGNQWLLIGGAIAIHPYKLYTIAAGILRVDLLHFFVASLVGRGAMFFAVGALLWWFGAPVRRFIERYFNTLTVVLGVVIIAIVYFMVRRPAGH